MNAVEFLVLIEGCAIRLFGEPGRLSLKRAIAMLDQLVADWSAPITGAAAGTVDMN